MVKHQFREKGQKYVILGYRSAKRRFALTAMATLGAGLLVTLLGVYSPVAGATPQYKLYSASASPTTVYAGVTTPVSVTLANSSNSNQSFGSAELTIGSLPESAVTSVSVPTGWSPSFTSANPAVILLTSSASAAIQPGASLSIQFQLVVPYGTASSFTIGTVVKQSNDFSGAGNNFKNTGSDPTITVVVPAVNLGFGPVPSPIQQSVPSTGLFYDMCPAVAVTSAETGQPVQGVPVTLADTPGPGLYFAGKQMPTSGVTVTSDSRGAATFGQAPSGVCQPGTGVEATVPGSGYTLTADAPGAAQAATSTSFSVVQYDQQCTGTCLAQVTGSTKTSASIDGVGTGTYQFVASFGQGSLECDSLVTTSAGDPVMVEMTPFGVNSSQPYALVTMTFPKQVVNSLANNGTPLMPVCAGAQVDFQGGTAVSGETGTDEYPDLDDTYPYQGLLADCPSGLVPGGSGTSIDFCVLSRQKNPGASETVQIYVGSTFTSDPSVW